MSELNLNRFQNALEFSAQNECQIAISTAPQDYRFQPTKSTRIGSVVNIYMAVTFTSIKTTELLLMCPESHPVLIPANQTYQFITGLKQKPDKRNRMTLLGHLQQRSVLQG